MCLRCRPFHAGRRSRSKVSFQVDTKVSFLESDDGGQQAGGTRTASSSFEEPSNPLGARAGSSKGGGSSGAGGYISTPAGQLCHMQVMRGSMVGFPLPQQGPAAVAAPAGGCRSDSSGPEQGHSASGDHPHGGELRGSKGDLEGHLQTWSSPDSTLSLVGLSML